MEREGDVAQIRGIMHLIQPACGHDTRQLDADNAHEYCGILKQTQVFEKHHKKSCVIPTLKQMSSQPQAQKKVDALLVFLIQNNRSAVTLICREEPK
jgi:hypothetical protein